MVALAAIFGRGNPGAIAVPPIAAAVTSMFIINADEQRKRIPEQSEKMQQIESRLETLETILTGSDYEQLIDSVRSSHPSKLSDRT
ncbi:hypothetical protein [Egbenema bharatensis]|uniref:hypothetical protein n=1 Tax=Egbenema bharatensis TaxID=3463334 RepID=UPI003A8C4C86